MKHYFIDLENVGSAGIHGAKDLTKNTAVHIFYSRNAKSLSMDAVAELTKGKAEIHYRKLTQEGHNAMDFEIVSIMGALVGASKEGEFHIISTDKGFLPAIRCLENEYGSNEVSIKLTDSIANATGARAQLITSHFVSVHKEQELDSRLQKMLIGSNFENHYDTIKSAIISTRVKQELHNVLIKGLGGQLGEGAYKLLKGSYYMLRDSIRC